MTKPALAAAAASLIMLGACGDGGADDGAANGANAAAPVNEAAPAASAASSGNDVNQASAAPAATPADGAVTREFLVGRWTEEEMNDCAGAVTEFRTDGSFAFPWGDTGRWTLDGDRLTMTGNDNALTVRAVDANTIEVRSPSRTYRNKRCT